MTEVIKDPHIWQDVLCKKRGQGLSVGFVPTMGALHRGHQSLMERGRRECDILCVSIFVNPTQFNQSCDLENYPQTWEADLEVLNRVGVDYLFFPPYDSLYPDDYTYRVTETTLSQNFCGATRPGHFDGVLSVVLKLLNLTGADKAYFGEKDWQQYRLIEGMAKAFFLNTQIVPCPLIREDDGLAMSSRNKRLTSKERELAPRFYQILSSEGTLERKRVRLEEAGFKVDYLETWDDRILGAVFLGEVRLIDNV